MNRVGEMHLKIRIFALAKELNMDSKLLIEYCQKLGIELKNSALASISPEEKDKVLVLIKQGPLAEGGAEASESSVPMRDVPRVVGGKVPSIKPVAPRPQRETRREPAPPLAEPATDVPPEPASAEPVQPPASVPPEALPVAEPERPAEVVEPRRGAAAAETRPDAPDHRSGRETPGGAPPPLRREDYMPASGAGARGGAGRESTDPGARRGTRQPKGRPGPVLPMLASPPPTPKTTGGGAAETPAQKPDVRFPKAVIAEGKPLGEHIRQHAAEKQKKKHPDVVDEPSDEPAKRPPGKAGAVKSPAAAGMGLLSERKKRQTNRGRGTALLETDEDAATPTSERIRPHRMRGKRMKTTTELKTSAVIELPITVRTLSAAIGRTASILIKSLYGRGTMATINSAVDEDTAVELALECGVDLEIKRGRDIEQELTESVSASNGEHRVHRPPIVTILGHVDHGKTTLLDTIRSANVAQGEVGGITQHIAAYQVERHGKRITFLDTPGHAAFGEMRARGANVTDIAVLVVAANDGVMPQTVEAISHAKAADVPIVVALNKCDLPDRNEQRVLQELAQHGVLTADWGGDTEVVRTSGLTGAGIDDLLETLLTVAELRELTADVERPAHGVCLESFRDEGRGVLAWLIVREGVLHKGDVVLCGPAYGRIRNIYNDLDQEVLEAGPSTPVRVAGLDIIPGAGSQFFTLSELEEARSVALSRRDRGRAEQLSQRGKPRTLQDILDAAQAGEVRELPVIVKADTPGSVEALKGELLKFQHAEVRVNILHEGVGGVNESDVYLASASGAIIIAFHVVPEDRAQQLAVQEAVEIRRYGIIYEVTDDIKLALEGLLKPEMVEIPTGRAVVLQTFAISRFGTIAGCRVLGGLIERTNRVHLIRDQRILHDYNILSLKRGKDDAKEVRDGLECGIRLEGFDDIKEGDIFQAYKIQEVKRTL